MPAGADAWQQAAWEDAWEEDTGDEGGKGGKVHGR